MSITIPTLPQPPVMGGLPQQPTFPQAEAQPQPVIQASVPAPAYVAPPAQEAPAPAPAPQRSGLPTPSWGYMIAAPAGVGAPKSILLYGAPGARKTSIAGSIIKVAAFKQKITGFQKVLYIDIDNGSEVLMTDPECRAAVEDGRIQIVPIDKLSPDAAGMVDFITKDVVANDYGYDAVILDSLDVAQEVMVKHKLATTYNDQGTKLDTLKAWGQVGVWTTDLAWGFQNSPHFLGIIVMHEKTEGEDIGKPLVKPKLQGGSKDSIAGIPSLVAHLSFQKGEDGADHIVANLGSSSAAVSKNRYRFDGEIVDFDLPLLYRMVDERINGTTNN
jgi:hypothetical protein